MPNPDTIAAIRIAVGVDTAPRRRPPTTRPPMPPAIQAALDQATAAVTYARADARAAIQHGDAVQDELDQLREDFRLFARMVFDAPTGKKPRAASEIQRRAVKEAQQLALQNQHGRRKIIDVTTTFDDMPEEN